MKNGAVPMEKIRKQNPVRFITERFWNTFCWKISVLFMM